MTMQSHAQKVHQAAPAEVIADVAFQVFSFHQSRGHNAAHAACGTTLPGKYFQSTLSPRTEPNNCAGCYQPFPAPTNFWWITVPASR